MAIGNRSAGEAKSNGSGRDRKRWWYCDRCGGLHPRAGCTERRLSGRRVAAMFEAAVHICACCAREPVWPISPDSSLFCEGCAPRVAAVNREVRDPRDHDPLIPAAGTEKRLDLEDLPQQPRPGPTPKRLRRARRGGPRVLARLGAIRVLGR